MSDLMSNYWGNFMHNSDPNGPNMGNYPLWPVYNATVDELMVLKEADEVTVQRGLKRQECDYLIPHIEASILKAFPTLLFEFHRK